MDGEARYSPIFLPPARSPHYHHSSRIPSGPLATTLALIPPFTPTMMVIRLASPVTIPVWQPVVGLLGVLLFTLFTVWVGARVFRTAILIQGQKPTVANLFKYAFKS